MEKLTSQIQKFAQMAYTTNNAFSYNFKTDQVTHLSTTDATISHQTPDAILNKQSPDFHQQIQTICNRHIIELTSGSKEIYSQPKQQQHIEVGTIEYTDQPQKEQTYNSSKNDDIYAALHDLDDQIDTLYKPNKQTSYSFDL